MRAEGEGVRSILSLSLSFSLYQSVYQSIHLSIFRADRSISLSIHRSIYLSVYLYHALCICGSQTPDLKHQRKAARCKAELKAQSDLPGTCLGWFLLSYRRQDGKDLAFLIADSFCGVRAYVGRPTPSEPVWRSMLDFKHDRVRRAVSCTGHCKQLKCLSGPLTLDFYSPNPINPPNV